MAKITNIQYEHHDCECCGCFSTGSFEVVHNDEVFEHYYDGHFGGGDWDGQNSNMYLLAIKDILDAHFIHIDTDHYTNSYGTRDIYHQQYSSDMIDSILKQSPDKIVYLKLSESSKTLSLRNGNETTHFPPAVFDNSIEIDQEDGYVYLDGDILFENLWQYFVDK